MPKKSKSKPRKRRKICQRDENWNKFIGFHLFEYNYPTILPTIFTSKQALSEKSLVFDVYYRISEDFDKKSG